MAVLRINGYPVRDEREREMRERQGIIAHPQPNLVKVKVGLG